LKFGGNDDFAQVTSETTIAIAAGSGTSEVRSTSGAVHATQGRASNVRNFGGTVVTSPTVLAVAEGLPVFTSEGNIVGVRVPRF
jgi:hypothetical protein